MEINIVRKCTAARQEKREKQATELRLVEETDRDRDVFNQLYEMTLDTDAERFDEIMCPVK